MGGGFNSEYFSNTPVLKIITYGPTNRTHFSATKVENVYVEQISFDHIILIESILLLIVFS